MMYPETPRSSQQAGPKVRQGALTEVKCAHVAATEEKGVPFRASVRDTHPLTTDRSGRLLRAGCELDASWMRAGCELDASWMRVCNGGREPDPNEPRSRSCGRRAARFALTCRV